MEAFKKIEQRAAKRKGGAEALEALLPKPKTARALAKVKDDRWLSTMSQFVFSAGFVWKIVEAKWPGFEEAFAGFDPAKVSRFTNKRMDKLATDDRVIKNASKLESVRDNARFIVEVAAEHGSFAKWIARWPEDDMVGLMDALKTRGSRLGGMSGHWLLRHMGKDTYMLGGDVVTALQRAKVIDSDRTSSKKARLAIQDAFNAWREQTGRPLCQLSKILACSVDGPGPAPRKPRKR
ncbi:MAG: DNA-3-methyladenine glycosylase I [Myxococcota bacterium]